MHTYCTVKKDKLTLAAWKYKRENVVIPNIYLGHMCGVVHGNTPYIYTQHCTSIQSYSCPSTPLCTCSTIAHRQFEDMLSIRGLRYSSPNTNRTSIHEHQHTKHRRRRATDYYNCVVATYSSGGRTLRLLLQSLPFKWPYWTEHD